MPRADWDRHNNFDAIKTRPASQAYRDGWEATFGERVRPSEKMGRNRCPYGGPDSKSSCRLPAGHDGCHERRSEYMGGRKP